MANEPVLVDSNIIIDVATGDPRWGEWSAGALAAAADHSQLLINPLIYAEVSVGYDLIEDVEERLPAELYRREALPYEAAFLAGKCFLAYRRMVAFVPHLCPTSTSGHTRPSPVTGC
ncbi:MAG: type II toxin-antitoxin system VapC family toxin [Mycobacteriales bacterium]